MIVIGGRHSSNTCKLRDVCKSNADTFLIETAQELKNIDLSKYSYVGVTAVSAAVAATSTSFSIFSSDMVFSTSLIITEGVEAPAVTPT